MIKSEAAKRVEREMAERHPYTSILAKHLDYIQDRQDAILDYLGVELKDREEQPRFKAVPRESRGE